MRRTVLVLICFCLFAVDSLAQDIPLVQRPEFDSNIRPLESWIESQIAYRDIPGMSIGIVYDQDLIWTRGFRYADREKKIPATPGTLYRIASISKLFTSIAIMKLRDEIKLRLDDPVEKHVPWITIKITHPDAPTITIRHLLTHTSGLPREAAFPYWTDRVFPAREQIIAALPEQEAICLAETKWKYSNLGLSLAG